MDYNFCVVTQPRSGDELLISKLRSHPNIYITLGNPYTEFLKTKEYSTFENFLHEFKYNTQNFNLKINEQDIMHSLNTKDYMHEYYSEMIKEGCMHEDERQNVDRFLDLIYSKDQEKKTEGYELAVKCALSRYKKYGMVVYHDHLQYVKLKNPKYIILLRKNLLWQFVSMHLPVSTNEHGYTKIIDTKINIDPDEFKKFTLTTYSQRAEIKQHVLATQQPFIEIYYEDLARNNRQTLDVIQKFLSVPIQKRDLYGINPENIYEETRPLETIVVNYSDIKKHFESDDDIYQYFQMAEESVHPFYYEIRKPGTFVSLDFLREMYDGRS